MKQQTEIQLIYRLSPALYAYDGEISQIDEKVVAAYAVAPFAGMGTATMSKRSKSRSREASATDNQTPVPSQQSIVQKLEQFLKSCEERPREPRYFAFNKHQRLQDTTLLPPCADSYTFKHFTEVSAKNEFVGSYMRQGYKQVSADTELEYLQTLADIVPDVHVFDSVGDILMLDRDMALETIFKKGLSPLQFEHRNFFVESMVFDMRYSEAYADQYRT